MVARTPVRRAQKLLAQSVFITLSGAVPAILNAPAQAASATISITGSFITGVQIAPGLNVQIGKIAVTAINGSIIISPAGVVNPSKAVTAGGAQQAGSFLFTAVNGTGPIDVTASGLGAVALLPTAGGAPAAGTAKINKIIIDGIGAAPLNLTDTGGGQATAQNYGLTTANGPIDIGIQLTWGAVQPIGSFSEAIVLTVSF